MSATTVEANQYLTFKLDVETYGLDISKVREVLDFTEITKLPKMPEFMRGVINLRGKVVPVVDLRSKFEMGETAKTVNTCIIITEVTVDNQSTLLGALVDSVQEVMDLEQNQIELPPRIGTRLNTEFIVGMGRRETSFIILLNIDRLFSETELAAINDTSCE